MVVLITGVTGGLGGVIGRMAADRGMTVYGTSRNPQGRENDFPFPLLQLDATSDTSVEACIGSLVEREGRIDVMINCVNEMFIGSVQEATVEEVKGLYDTNVFGVMRLCREVVPVMQRQGGGTIVNMSSLGGLLAVPYMGAYTSAKFALEAFSEALYHEVKPDNISVVIMQPVAMHMDRPDTGHHLRLVENVAERSISHKMLRRMVKDTAASKLTPEMVSEKILQVIAADRKPLRVPMDKAKGITVIKRLAPQAMIDKMIGGLIGSAAAKR
jgi:short-subunit dehydrogenase